MGCYVVTRTSTPQHNGSKEVKGAGNYICIAMSQILRAEPTRQGYLLYRAYYILCIGRAGESGISFGCSGNLPFGLLERAVGTLEVIEISRWKFRYCCSRFLNSPIPFPDKTLDKSTMPHVSKSHHRFQALQDAAILGFECVPCRESRPFHAHFCPANPLLRDLMQ